MKPKRFIRWVAVLCLVSFATTQVGWERPPSSFYLAPKSEWSFDRRDFLKMVAKAGIAAGMALFVNLFAAPNSLFAQEGPVSNERVDELIRSFKAVVERAGVGRPLPSSQRWEAIRILNSFEALAPADVPDALNRLIELLNWDKINYDDKPELIEEILRVVFSFIENHRDQTIYIQLFRVNPLQGYPHGREVYVRRDSEERPLSARIGEVPQILMEETMARLDVYMGRRPDRARPEVVASENYFISESERHRDSLEIRLTAQIYRLYVRAVRAGLATFHWEYLVQTVRDFCQPGTHFHQWTHYGVIQAIAEMPLEKGRVEEALELLAFWEQYVSGSNPGPNYWEERERVEELLRTTREELNRREAERVAPPAEQPVPALEPAEEVEASTTPPAQISPAETQAPVGITETRGATAETTETKEVAAEESWSDWLYLLLGAVIVFALAALLYKLWWKRSEVINIPPAAFPNLPLRDDLTLPLAEENSLRDSMEIELHRRRQTIQFGPWRVTPLEIADEMPSNFLGTPVQIQTAQTPQAFSGWLTGNYLILAQPVSTPRGPHYRAFDVKKNEEISMQLLTTEHQSYWVIAELGRGGMGAVYEVWNPILSRYEAVKTLLPPGFSSNREVAEAITRFRREALILGQVSVNHPNIVGMHRFGAQPFPHFVMDRIRGKNLSSLVEERKKGLTPQEIEEGKAGLPLDQVVEIGLQAAKGLHHVHTTPVQNEKNRTCVGIVHRDIKPANIFLDEGGRVLITDFGLVLVMGMTQLTQTGSVLGTPLYMAPEQWVGKGASTDPGEEDPVDARADIYALGAVLFYLVNGYPPYKGNVISIQYSMLKKKRAPFRPGTPPELKRIIEKAMAYEKEDRFQSVAEMAQALAALKQREPGAAFSSLEPVEVAL